MMIPLSRADIERITENVLRNLTIEVKNGDFVSPNDRIIELKYKGEVISETRFDVVQNAEYEG